MKKATKTDQSNQDELMVVAEKAGVPKSILAKVGDQKRVRTDDFISLYANNVSVSISLWDVGMIFGEILGEEDGKAVIEETVKIVMSREMAKIMNLLLTANIADYEKKNGTIHIPDLFKGRKDDEAEVIGKKA